MIGTGRRLSRVMPPVVLDVIDRWNPRAIRIDDTFKSWAEATSSSDGYKSEVILECVEKATIEVTEGRAAFERDGVTFSAMEVNWPVLSHLLLVAAETGRLRVVDFGGSLGSVFWQHQQYFRTLSELSWTVVEQPHFVDRGCSRFATDCLNFLTAEELRTSSQPFDVMLLSSVLQYLPDPTVVSDLLAVCGAKYVIIDKTPVVEGPETLVAVQRVPSKIYPASYPLWLFSSRSLDRITPTPWRLDAGWSSAGPQRTKKGARVAWRGRFLVNSDLQRG